MLYLSGLLLIGLMLLVMYLVMWLVWLEMLFGGMDWIYCMYKWVGILVGVFVLMYWLIEMFDDILKVMIGWVGCLLKEELGGLLVSLCDFVEDFGEWGIYVLIVLLLLMLWKVFFYWVWWFLYCVMLVIYLILVFYVVLLVLIDYW